MSQPLRFNAIGIPKQERVLVCVGTSHSGKSTYCNKWVRGEIDELNPSGRPRTIVCADSIRLALHGKRYNSIAEPMVFAIKSVMIRAMLARDFDVIIDGTHTTQTSLKRILEIDPSATALVFDTPLETCLERTKLTNQPDMMKVIPRHRRQIDALLSEGLEKVMTNLVKEINIRWDKGKII